MMPVSRTPVWCSTKHHAYYILRKCIYVDHVCAGGHAALPTKMITPNPVLCRPLRITLRIPPSPPSPKHDHACIVYDCTDTLISRLSHTCSRAIHSSLHGWGRLQDEFPEKTTHTYYLLANNFSESSFMRSDFVFGVLSLIIVWTSLRRSGLRCLAHPPTAYYALEGLFLQCPHLFGMGTVRNIWYLVAVMIV